MENKIEKLFVYGTLREPQVQEKIFKKIIIGMLDKLCGYEKKEIEINNNKYWTLVPGGDSCIEGCVLELNEEQIKEADIYETEAYRRIVVNLESGAESWVYVKN